MNSEDNVTNLFIIQLLSSLANTYTNISR